MFLYETAYKKDHGLLISGKTQVCLHFKHHKVSAISFFYILDEEDVSWADIYNTQQLKIIKD